MRGKSAFMSFNEFLLLNGDELQQDCLKEEPKTSLLQCKTWREKKLSDGGRSRLAVPYLARVPSWAYVSQAFLLCVKPHP